MNQKIFIKNNLLLIFYFVFFSSFSQWRYPNYKNIKDDVVITYKVEYQNKLTEKQKKSSRFKKEIIVYFNQNKLVEKTINHIKARTIFRLLDYEKDKFYKCYKSAQKKEAIVSNLKTPEKKVIPKNVEKKEILGFKCDVSEVLTNGEMKEILTTKEIGLRYVRFYNTNGFLLKYTTKDKILGPYTVTATKIDYTKLSEKEYSLDGYTIKSKDEQKKYLREKKQKRNLVKLKAAKKLNSKAPNFIASTINNKVIKSKKIKDTVVVYTFWFLKSDSSIRQITQLNKLKRKFKNKKVTFIAVTLDKEHKIRNFLKTNTFDYNIIEDGSWIAKKFDIKLFPTNIIIDKKGNYQYYKTSYNSDIFESMSFKIEQLLTE